MKMGAGTGAGTSTGTDKTTATRPGDPGTLLFENERVRVWELIMKPGEVCEWHVHDNDYLLVVTEGALIQAQEANGKSLEFPLDDQKVFYVPGNGIPEIARNASPDRTLRQVMVELKDDKIHKTRMGGAPFYRPETPTTTHIGELSDFVKPADITRPDR